MIKLTQQQIEAVQNSAAIPPVVVNPDTQEAYVLLRADEYERLMMRNYDDSPWTREELESAAWDLAERSDWDEYDDSEVPQKL